MAEITWVKKGDKEPPLKERLLLIVDAAGNPPDAQLMDTSEVLVGYWTGSMFHPMTVDHADLGARLDVEYWAKISYILPEEIALRPEHRFDPDVRD